MLGSMRDATTELDLAVIGAGAAGTSVAISMQRARPDWAIALFERTDRIGGRLRSVRIDGLDHPIELGGMRYLTSHRRVAAILDSLGIGVHPFDATGGAPERSYLRGVVGAGTDDPDAGRGYDLGPDQAGRSASELASVAFERIVPGFQSLDHEGHVRRRATGRLLDRPVTDWPIGEAFEAIVGREGYSYLKDAFGYDSGMRAFNAPDFVEFVFGGGDPSGEARTPDDGMDVIPRAQAEAFERAGGAVQLEHQLGALASDGGDVQLSFTNGRSIRAARVVLATPVPAIRLLAQTSPVLEASAFDLVLDSVEAFPAMKLYLWFDRPWWRPAVAGIRTTTDLPVRKVFYLDGGAGSHATLLGMYTDGLDVQPWARLYEGAPAGAPAPAAMIDAVLGQLRDIHPEVADIPTPLGSALMYWGADDRETAWHFWRAGSNSDEVLELAPQPDRSFPIFLANEAFSRRQSWVEGALEAADAAVDRLLAFAA